MRAWERLPVALSLAFGLGYPLLWSQSLPAAAMIAVKGAGVGLLALAGARRARTLDGWLLAAVMAMGALGDDLLEIDLATGAAAFAAGHGVAILLYLRNRHQDAGQSDRAMAVAIPVIAMAVPAYLLHGRPQATPFVFYALLLGAMAASAWLSRFPRLVALGALLFLASDLLIAVRMTVGLPELGLPIWLLYYLGQLMIFLGINAALPPRERSSGGGGPPKVVEG